jgi:hypothetical protein
MGELYVLQKTTTMSEKSKLEDRKPWASSIGLALLIIAVVGGVLTIKSANDTSPGFGGMGAGFAVMGLWMIVIPVSFILGVISSARKEKPRVLSRILLVLCAVPIFYFFVIIRYGS